MATNSGMSKKAFARLADGTDVLQRVGNDG
jgi:hypothetical protein